MSAIRVCDWCHGPIQQRNGGHIMVLSGSREGELQRDFHTPSLIDGGRDCLAEWVAMVRLAEEHHQLMEEVTSG